MLKGGIKMTKTLSLRSTDIPFGTLHKFGIGFDSLLDNLMEVTRQQSSNYPPHNVIKTGEDTVTIELAVAGFKEDEITVTVDRKQLIITGTKNDEVSNDSSVYLYRGLSSRNFRQTFQLADHVEVTSAEVKNGILTIYLERIVPESQKPKTIQITYTK